mmetsp:Transcript_31631/g.51384  ORF Transcript_31631/g.51384 Transcript_31631/m.51384 type:complete len:251 (+) Transcript_31631:76-828(+)
MHTSWKAYPIANCRALQRRGVSLLTRKRRYSLSFCLKKNKNGDEGLDKPGLDYANTDQIKSMKTNMDDLLPPGTPQLKKVPSLNRGRSSDPISEEQVKEYKEAWKLFDLDGDGSISRDELRKLMKSTGQVYTEEELTRIIEEADEDGNGEIDFNEFLSIMTAPTSIKDEIKATFDIFDQSRRGFFDFVDIKKVMHSIGENLSDEEATTMFREADVDKDGRVTLEDMVAMIKPPAAKFKRRGSIKSTFKST